MKTLCSLRRTNVLSQCQDLYNHTSLNLCFLFGVVCVVRKVKKEYVDVLVIKNTAALLE